MEDNLFIFIYKNSVIRALAVTFIAAYVYLNILAPVRQVHSINLKISDILFSIVHKYNPTPRQTIDKMVLVSIDDTSFRKMNVHWPWSRGIIAGLIKKISECSPSMICLDMTFVGKSMDENQDLMVAKAAKDAKNVYVAAYFGEDGTYVVPTEMIAKNVADFGFINKPRDIDNSVRRVIPYVLSDTGHIMEYSLALKLAANRINETPEDIINNQPVLKKNNIYMNFFGSETRFLNIPAWRVFSEDKDRLAGLLKGKMVFIGVTSEIFHDIYPTPLGLMSGVGINMNEFLDYATGSFLYRVNKDVDFVVIFIFVFLAILVSMLLPFAQSMLLHLANIAAFIAGSLFLYFNNIIIDYFGVLFIVTSCATFLSTYKYAALIISNMALKKEAVTDGLTRLYVYRYFELRLKSEFKAAKKEHKKLVLIFYDLDHFKRVNDSYGHEFGNAVLKSVADTIKKYSRTDSTVARYGGEEFCVLIPGISAKDAIKYAERIRSKVKELSFVTERGESVNITISGGLVSLDESDRFEEAEDLMKAADSALYRSKATGRDKISVFNY